MRQRLFNDINSGSHRRGRHTCKRCQFTLCYISRRARKTPGSVPVSVVYHRISGQYSRLQGFGKQISASFEQWKLSRYVYGYSAVQTDTIKLRSVYLLQKLWRRKISWQLLWRVGVLLNLRRRYNVPESLWRGPIAIESRKVLRPCNGHALQS